MNVLFVGKAFEKVLNNIEKFLYSHSVRVIEVNDLCSEIHWADVLILRPMEFGEEQLSNATRLKMVQQWGVGIEGLDVDACANHGVYACNVPSRGTGNAESVAEIAIMHMLLLSRRFARATEKLGEGKIFTPPGKSLWRKRACIVGLGDLGHSICERLLCLGMEVTGVNRTLRREFTDWGISSVYPVSRMDSAFKGASFVILSLPLNKDTRGIIGERELRFMDKDTFLINVARGDLVQRGPLEEALDNGLIAGAGLDVLWDEPHSPDDPMLSRKNVSLTPHIGGVTDSSFKGVSEFIIQNIERISRGEKPSSCLNC